MTEDRAPSAEPLCFEAADGQRLAGTLLRPGEPRLAILVSPGTGFPASFYRRAGEHLARRGAAVLLYDYRGIGASAPPDLARFAMEYTDWGRLDMPAALDALAAAAPGLPVGHLAHSVGGHFVGFMPNHAGIRRHAFVAVGSGYWRDHPLRFNPFELWFWHVLGPAGLRRRGYVPRGWGWRGAPLPRGVFETWRRWCLTPGYFRDELAQALRPHHFEEVRAPIRSWVFADDPIANARTAPAILEAYPAAPAEVVARAPRELGARRVGHDGAFRPAARAVWDEWWEWLARGHAAAPEPVNQP